MERSLKLFKITFLFLYKIDFNIAGGAENAMQSGSPRKFGVVSIIKRRFCKVNAKKGRISKAKENELVKIIQKNGINEDLLNMI